MFTLLQAIPGTWSKIPLDLQVNFYIICAKELMLSIDGAVRTPSLVEACRTLLLNVEVCPQDTLRCC